MHTSHLLRTARPVETIWKRGRSMVRVWLLKIIVIWIAIWKNCSWVANPTFTSIRKLDRIGSLSSNIQEQMVGIIYLTFNQSNDGTNSNFCKIRAITKSRAGTRKFCFEKRGALYKSRILGEAYIKIYKNFPYYKGGF